MTYKWFIFGNSSPFSFSTLCFRKGGGDNGEGEPDPPDDATDHGDHSEDSDADSADTDAG